MSNVHRLHPIPKIKRRGVVRVELDESIRISHFGATLAIGDYVLTNVNGTLRIEPMKAHGRG